MNLEDILREVRYCCKSQQTINDLKGMANRAIKTIAERANWSAMHDRRPITIPTGYTNAPMGPAFKQLSGEESPVSFVYGNYSLAVQVTSRSRIELSGIWPFPNGPFSFPVPGGFMPIRVVFFERNGPGGQWTINVPPQFSITQNAIFNVHAYWYPAPLVKGSDTNPFTEDGNLSDAIMMMTRAYALRSEDPASETAMAAKAEAEEAITRAMYSDAAISLGGRPLRM